MGHPACIDAAEMAQAPYRVKASEYLRLRLPTGQPVTLKVQTTDRYGRTVVEDWQEYACRKYLGWFDAREDLAAEYRASHSRCGVWQVPGGITRPWDLRRGRRFAEISSCATGTSSAGR
jgi:endonuclease YncB( thermonuclease family)